MLESLTAIAVQSADQGQGQIWYFNTKKVETKHQKITVESFLLTMFVINLDIGRCHWRGICRFYEDAVCYANNDYNAGTERTGWHSCRAGWSRQSLWRKKPWYTDMVEIHFTLVRDNALYSFMNAHPRSVLSFPGSWSWQCGQTYTVYTTGITFLFCK